MKASTSPGLQQPVMPYRICIGRNRASAAVKQTLSSYEHALLCFGVQTCSAQPAEATRHLTFACSHLCVLDCVHCVRDAAL